MNCIRQIFHYYYHGCNIQNLFPKVQVSNDLLTTYLDEYEETPFDALKFLISEANYGGRVTDEIDRRVLAAYLNQFYCPPILSVPNYKLSTLSVYHVPDDGTLQTHREFIKTLPTTDSPEAFGQHANADIAFQLSDSRLLLQTIAGLQGGGSGGASGGSTEELVLNICQNLLLQVNSSYYNHITYFIITKALLHVFKNRCKKKSLHGQLVNLRAKKRVKLGTKRQKEVEIIIMDQKNKF
jgi:hypothetical protein